MRGCWLWVKERLTYLERVWPRARLGMQLARAQQELFRIFLFWFLWLRAGGQPFPWWKERGRARVFLPGCGKLPEQPEQLGQWRQPGQRG